MRMRKKKNGASRMEKCKHWLAEIPKKPIESTVSDFGRQAPLWLEIGAGKGGFARKMSAAHPEVCLYALERSFDCIVLATESAEAQKDTLPDNVRYMVANADNLPLLFAPGSVDRVFLNFSDPWSKKGYYKRRLTYRKYLAMYFTLLKEGGELQFKTDNDGLFAFTLEELAAMGVTPSVVTDDLHASAYMADNIETEYEAHFVALGMKIHMLRVTRPTAWETVPSAQTTLSHETSAGVAQNTAGIQE